MTPIRWILLGALFVIITAFPLRSSLRSGVVHLKGPHGRVEWRKQPLLYWSNIYVTTAVLLIGIGMIVWGIISAMHSAGME
jgi:hypothetical protein